MVTSKRAPKSKPAPKADASQLRPGHTELFLPAELEDFFEGDQPQPGDVLLLDGDGITSKLSRLVQGKSAYSHVGLVIGSDLYIDAVGEEGVRVRRLTDLHDPKHQYALQRCKVARNQRVIATQVAVWPSAIAYYERPYRLWSVFMKPGGAEVEDDPVICSKLVAQILEDIGFKLSLPVQRTMPKHLAEACNGGDWKQFALLKYDLFDQPRQVVAERPKATEAWLKVLEPLHEANKAFRKLLKQFRRTPP
jgi:Permuted papain-like amidase enzyme, YaeF/YiiX, C92 family